MPATRSILSISAALVIAVITGLVQGQNYPSKPVRIVAPGIGGLTDIVGRIVAVELTKSLGQPVIIDNRGGNEVIPGDIVAKAPPDGYTLLFYGSSVWLAPYMRERLPWDPIKDFAPVMAVVSYPNLLVVRPAMPAKTVKELIALAKAKPGELNFATTGTGNASHLASELFKSMAGVNITRINYANPGPAFNDVIAGQVQLMFATAGSVIPFVKSGRLIGLGMSSAQRSKLMPEVPTIAEAGLPGYESIATNGLFAPAGTPSLVINRLNEEIVRVLNKPDVREKLFNVATEVVGNSPQQFAQHIKSEMARMGKVIKDAGIRDE